MIIYNSEDKNKHDFERFFICEKRDEIPDELIESSHIGVLCGEILDKEWEKAERKREEELKNRRIDWGLFEPID